MQSAEFPNRYRGGSSCQWTIVTNPRYKIHLEAKNFSVQDCSQCECDNVAIYDGDSSESRALGNCCTSPFNVISTGQSLHVTFSSNLDISSVQDFRLHMSQLKTRKVSVMSIISRSRPGGIVLSYTAGINHYAPNLKKYQKCLKHWLYNKFHSKTKLSVWLYHCSYTTELVNMSIIATSFPSFEHISETNKLPKSYQCTTLCIMLHLRYGPGDHFFLNEAGFKINSTTTKLIYIILQP